MSYSKYIVGTDPRQRSVVASGNSGINNSSRNSFPTVSPSSHYIPNNDLPSAHFRSAAEASLDSSSKFRQLPCKTLIAVGTCPYGERCVFLHDPRLICHTAHSISRLKNKEDTVVDSFFWPLAASADALNGQLALQQNKKSDHNFRPYSIPPPKNDQFRMHDQALYSIWMHYVEFCRVAAKEQKSYGTTPKLTPQDLPINVFTQTARLPVFQLLSSSNGMPINREQYQLVVNHDINTESLMKTTLPSNRQSPPAVSAIVQSIPVIKVDRSESPTSVQQRYVFSPDERLLDQQHQNQFHQQQQQLLTKHNSYDKMMMMMSVQQPNSNMNITTRRRSHSGETSSGFPSYMSENDDFSIGNTNNGLEDDWNNNVNCINNNQFMTANDQSSSWVSM